MSDNKVDKLCCGLVMPISALDGCNEQHWLDVKSILTEAVEGAGCWANLVSNADDVGIIQKRIIQNLYCNPIVVCDVSGKNPNVMFELGMRLAFDKPTIIVKDDKTSYSFDTSPIEHLEYPRDLRFSKIVEFKGELTKKIQATLHKSQTEVSYTAFLKHFGTFTVAKLDSKEVTKEDYIIEELKDVKKQLSSINQSKVKVSEHWQGRYPQHTLKDIVQNLIEAELISVGLNFSEITESEISSIKTRLMSSEKIAHFFNNEEEFYEIFNQVINRAAMSAEL